MPSPLRIPWIHRFWTLAVHSRTENKLISQHSDAFISKHSSGYHVLFPLWLTWYVSMYVTSTLLHLLFNIFSGDFMEYDCCRPGVLNWGQFCHLATHDIWQCLETFLMVTTRKVLLVSMVRGQKCCSASKVHRQPSQQRIIWSKMLTVSFCYCGSGSRVRVMVHWPQLRPVMVFGLGSPGRHLRQVLIAG